MESKECKLSVLELFSGIGGMHYALEGNNLIALSSARPTNYFQFVASGISGEVVAAIDINTTADRVYRHNHPDTKVLNNNIQKFKPKELLKMNINCILMSPPCQPFTRVGNKKDIDDARTNALLHICNILDKLETVDYILMENVKGFETSQARDLYIDALKRAKFNFQEFILSPTEIGVPNTRYRYYCLARKTGPFPFQCDEILERLPSDGDGDGNEKTARKSPLTVKSVIDESIDDFSAYLLSDEVLLKRAWLLDIVHPTSTNTICFTKAYTHYTEGTGSVYCPHSWEQLDKVFESIKSETMTAAEKLTALKTLELRYFTPAEVAKLMSFPDKFKFPNETTNRQRYRVLGNSINVALVGKLVKLLCTK